MWGTLLLSARGRIRKHLVHTCGSHLTNTRPRFLTKVSGQGSPPTSSDAIPGEEHAQLCFWPKDPSFHLKTKAPGEESRTRGERSWFQRHHRGRNTPEWHAKDPEACTHTAVDTVPFISCKRDRRSLRASIQKNTGGTSTRGRLAASSVMVAMNILKTEGRDDQTG